MHCKLISTGRATDVPCLSSFHFIWSTNFNLNDADVNKNLYLALERTAFWHAGTKAPTESTGLADIAATWSDCAVVLPTDADQSRCWLLCSSKKALQVEESKLKMTESRIHLDLLVKEYGNVAVSCQSEFMKWFVRLFPCKVLETQSKVLGLANFAKWISYFPRLERNSIDNHRLVVTSFIW